jgi:hypothetical protein
MNTTPKDNIILRIGKVLGLEATILTIFALAFIIAVAIIGSHLKTEPLPSNDTLTTINFTTGGVHK